MGIKTLKEYAPDFLVWGIFALSLYAISACLTFFIGGTAPRIADYIFLSGIAWWWGKREQERAKETCDLSDRIWRVEKSLQKLDEQYAYKIDVSVIPDWGAIFAKLYGSKNWHDEFDEATKKDYHNPEKAGRSIAWQQFRFVEFFDSTNYGLGMLWSDYRKSFVYDYEVWGSILADDSLAQLVAT